MGNDSGFYDPNIVSSNGWKRRLACVKIATWVFTSNLVTYLVFHAANVSWEFPGE